MVSKFNISFTILCRIVRCNFLNLACCAKSIAMGARESFRHFFGFENFGPVIFLGRLNLSKGASLTFYMIFNAIYTQAVLNCFQI